MDISSLQPGHAPALYAIYREATARAGHCRFFPSEARFAQALLAPERPDTQLFVAEERGAARGFAALVPLRPGDDNEIRAAVNALFVADDAAGQALLEACAQRAAEAGVSELHAFSSTHFRCPVPGYNGGWNGLSDQLPAVARLLARNGFGPYYRELHLSCDLRRFPQAYPEPLARVEVTRTANAHGGYKLAPTLGGKHAGDCEYGTLVNLSDHPGAARCGYIWGIGIAESARRRGIARHLMRHALAHLQELGCDACWLTTGSGNWPAQPLYLSLGFEIVDASASFRRGAAL
jgi:ribosomal protein S18 acetylase RimI-like enzyme